MRAVYNLLTGINRGVYNAVNKVSRGFRDPIYTCSLDTFSETYGKPEIKLETKID